MRIGDDLAVSDEPQESTPESEPEPSSWDTEAEQLRSSALIPAAGAPPLPAPSVPAPPGPAVPPPAASPSPPPVKPSALTPRPTATLARPATDFSTVPRPIVAPRGFQPSAAPMPPGAASSNDVVESAESPVPAPVLTKELQEQLFGIIRASLETTLAPLHEKQSELEARIAVLRAAPTPMAATPAAMTVVKSPTMPPLRPMQPSVSVDITPHDKTVSTAPPAALKPSFTSTSYGLVIDIGSRRPPPQLEQDLANVGPIDMPDFGGHRRRAGRVLVGLLLALVVAAIIATILSYN